MGDTISCKRLLFAILERAVVDACHQRGKRDASGNSISCRCRREARTWLLEWTSGDSVDPFTFPWVCWHLDLDPRTVSERVHRLILSGVPVRMSKFTSSITDFLTDDEDVSTAALRHVL